MSEHVALEDSDQPNYDIVLVDQSQDARDAARDAADKQLTNELNQGGHFKRFIKGIWKGNLAKDYYRAKRNETALGDIVESQDILVHESTDGVARDSAMYATFRRFLSEYDEMIDRDAGEDTKELGKDSELGDAVKGLIRRYENGDLDDTSLIEEKARMLQAYREQSGEELLGDGLVQVDNLLEIAKSVKGAVQHGESLDNILDNMRVVSAESRSNVRTEVNYTRTDRILEKLGKTKIGSLAPEATIAAVTIASSVARLGSQKAIRAAAMTLAPGIGSGIVAGLREHKRVQEDRAQHSREMAQGKLSEVPVKRRDQMEQTRYETKSATDLTDTLNAYMEDDKLDSDAALQQALDSLSAIRARVDLSNQRHMDLISYSDSTAIEEQRFNLALARAQVKAALDRRLNTEVRQRLNIGDEAIDDLIADREQQFIDVHETDISLKDKNFRRLRNRRIAKMAAVGATVGLVMGTTVQEAMASASSHLEGAAEQAWGAHTDTIGGKVHQTLLESALGDKGGAHAESMQYIHESITAQNGKIDLPGGGSFDRTAAGTFSFHDANGGVHDMSGMYPDGGFTPQDQEFLAQHGISVQNLSYVHDINHSEVKSLSVQQYLTHNKASTMHITRDMWYDNNTPTPDHDELGLHWGGSSDTGVGPNGEVQMSVATMTHDGSWHNGLSTNWQQDATQGHLKLAISPTEGTQATPIIVSVGPNGMIDIPKGSPAAAFFKVENGHQVFTGKYAEVVQTMGADSKGVEHVRPLATLVGNSSVHEVSTRVNVATHELVPKYEVTIAKPIEAQRFTEMAPVIPITSRRSLEQVRRAPDIPGYYYGSYNRSPEEVNRFRRDECSPRLNRDPKAHLNPGDELAWRREMIGQRQGSEYVEEIDRYIGSSPELANLSPETKAIVTIPVAAASEQDNIYNTLQSYGMQEGGLDTTTFLLHVNWFDHPSKNSDGSYKVTQDEWDANVRRTFEEIERARRDFPNLKIAVMQTEWEQTAKERGDYGDGIIGHVARRMYDTAMMSVEHQMREGNLSRDQDVLLIRNDSDAHGIQRTYLNHMVKAMNDHPEKDVFTGAIRWGTERHRDLPGFGVVSNFREIMHVLASRKDSDMWPPTIGINTAVRMSTFAAVGGAGDDPGRTGIGTDDLSIGGRVKDARQTSGQSRTRTYGYGRTNDSTRGNRVSGYGSRGLHAAEDFSYHQTVTGAAIDTAPDRLESAYNDRVPISDAWSDWDNKTRSEGLETRREDLRDSEQADEILDHIENDLNKALRDRFHSRQQNRTGLAFLFPDARYYRVNEDNTGKLQFNLTPSGRRFLLNRLQRDTRGRYDPYGNRARRQLYNEVSKRARKQPLAAQPRLV